MGMMPMQQGNDFVIASDSDPHTAAPNRAPKRMATAPYMWTGSAWSMTATDAKTFFSAEDADEYVRAHYAQLTAARRIAASS